MNRNKYSSYIPLDSEKTKKQMLAIEKCWKSYLSEVTSLQGGNVNITMPEYSVDVLALREIVERVYQRKDYFIRFHSGMVMSEYKEIGLNMFWITKFKPFRILNNSLDEETSFRANEDFAMYYMLTALKNLSKKLGLKYDSDRISANLYSELLYTLCFRDISKEAIGIIVELIANIVIIDLPSEV